ncbi:hypothetical protein ACWCQ7_46325, partial [Streptomyces spinosirectus]
GRAWRRKAPVESLMPLRLARYGVPLAETTPAGLAAASIEVPVLTVDKDTSEPPTHAVANPVAHHDDKPGTGADTASARTPSPAASPQSGRTRHGVQVDTTVHHTDPGRDVTHEQPAALTTVDRYYLAWTDLRSQHGDETLTSTHLAEQLSTHLATKGLYGRSGQPVSPATLRRYLLPFRLYHLWARQRQAETAPSAAAIAKDCAVHGITAQYNKPITADHITELAGDFERRWQALAHPTSNDPNGPLRRPE